MKERILQKAEELFDRYGVRSVTMDEIASTLGISKKTIYLSFSDKEELVDAIFCSRMNENQHDCVKDSERAENAVHEVFLAWDRVSKMLSTMNPSILYDLQKYHPEVYKKYHHFKHGFMYKMISANIQRGIKEELYREDINTDILARMRIGTIMMSFNQEIFPVQKYKPVEVEECLFLHFLQGLVTAKGLKIFQKYRQQRLMQKV